MGEERERTPGPGDRGQPSGRNLGAAREEWDPGPEDSGARPGPAWTLGGASEVAAATPGSAQGQSPSRRRAGPRSSPAPSLGAPLPTPRNIAQGRWSPPSLGFEPSPSFPWGLGPAVPGERTKVLAGGTGRKRDLLDLDRRGHFPSSGIWPCSPQPTPAPPGRAPFFLLLSPLGCFCVLEARINSGRCSCSGRCLFGSLNCILSRQRLLAEESDEYRAVEQVVPEMEIGKPVVSSSEVSLVRKWAFPPNQPALIQTYRMPREHSLELPGEGWDRKDLVSTPVQLGENKCHND